MATSVLNHLDFGSSQQIKNVLFDIKSTIPTGVTGQFLFNASTGKFGYFNGSIWVYPNEYSLPTATASVLGGVKVGTTLEISSGVLNQKSGVATAGTYRSVVVDTYGRVTSGSNPTTLSGYGITDAKIESGVITLGSVTITPATTAMLNNAIPNNMTTAGHVLLSTGTGGTSAWSAWTTKGILQTSNTGVVSVKTPTLWGVTFTGDNITTAPNLYIGTTKVQTSSTEQHVTGVASLTIGDAVLSWDSTNKALKLTKKSGTTTDIGFWAEGFVSAFGPSATEGGGTDITAEDIISILNAYTPGEKIKGDVLDVTGGGGGLSWTDLQNSSTGHIIDASHLPTNITVLPSKMTSVEGTLNSSRSAHYVYAAPSSAAGVPTWRALVASDIPSLTKSKISDFPTTWAWSSVSGRPTKLSDFTDDVVSGHYLPTSSFTASNIVSTLGTTAVAKATDADTVDGCHYTTQNDIGYTHYKTVTLDTTSVWYVSMSCTRSYISQLQWIAVNPGYDNNMAEMRICLYDYRGKWRALTSEYNNCNVLGMQTSLGNNPTLYFKMRAPASSGTFRVWAPFNFTLTASTTAPSGITFDDIIQGAYIGYERLRINGISPIANNTNSLGTASLRWSSVYTYGLFAAGNANIDGTLNVAGNASAKSLFITGSANSSGYISADSATNMFVHIGDKTMLVADSSDNCVRRGSTNADATLGTPTYPWANVYATRFYLGSSGANYIMSCNSAFSAGADLNITGYSNSQIPTLTLKATTINMLNTTSVQMASANVSIGGTLGVTGATTVGSLKIGSGTLSWDSTNSRFTASAAIAGSITGNAGTVGGFAPYSSTAGLVKNSTKITTPAGTASWYKFASLSGTYAWRNHYRLGIVCYGGNGNVTQTIIDIYGTSAVTSTPLVITQNNGTTPTVYYIKVCANSTNDIAIYGYVNSSSAQTLYLNAETAPANMGMNGSDGSYRLSLTLSSGALTAVTPSETNQYQFQIRNGLDCSGITRGENMISRGYIRAVGEITGFYSSSDLRLKKNFADLNLGLDAVANLPLKSYDRTDRNNKRTDGTIAQEVQKLLPNEVYDRGDGYLAMAEGQLGLIFGINAHKEILRLRKRVEELERRLDA